MIFSCRSLGGWGGGALKSAEEARNGCGSGTKLGQGMIILAAEMPSTLTVVSRKLRASANCDVKCHDPYPTHGRVQGVAEPKGGWGEGLRGWRGGLRGTGLNLIRLSDGPWSLRFMLGFMEHQI